MLIDVCSKIFNRLMIERYFQILDAHGTKYQFGGTPKIGCRDGPLTLKTLLNMRKNHYFPMFVVFIDLIKVFDIANHKLLIKY